jgi:hypothetical protein
MSHSLKICFLLSLAEKYRPVGARLMSVRVLGGHHAPYLIEHRAVGSCSSPGLFQPAGSLLKRTLDVERGFPGLPDEEPWRGVS